MAIQFTITDTRNPDEKFTRAFVQNKVTIGRARHCDICLPDLSVSTGHAEIRFQNNDYFLVDTGSLNGTWCQNRKLVAHRPRVLCNGDRFMVSRFEIAFTLNAPYGTSSERNLSHKQALQMLSAALASNHTGDFPEPDLKSIQDAPEDETASFCTNIGADADDPADMTGQAFETDAPLPAEDNGVDPATARTADKDDNPMASSRGISQAVSTDETGLGDANNFDLPTGPEDPLAPSHVPAEQQPQRVSSSPGRKKSDLGLIVAGAIIVTTCVVVLIRLLA